MGDRISIAIELLSAGVIAALVTGIFSLIIAFKNNRRLIELENKKQRFAINQERYKDLRNAYTELLNQLPEEQRLGHIIMNLPTSTTRDLQEHGFSGVYDVAEANMKIIYVHFQKYRYLFSDDEQKQVLDIVETIDSISRSLIASGANIHLCDAEADECTDDSMMNAIREVGLEKLEEVVKLEILYHDLFQKNLSELSK